MKNLIRVTLSTAAICALLASTAYAENTDAGWVDFGNLPPMEGAEFVEVNIKSNLISMVAKLAKQSEPEVAEALSGIKHIRVNVLGLTDENRDQVQKQVKSIRSILDTKGWERIVTSIKKDEDVGIYMKTRGDEAVEGVLVTVLKGDKEAILVNVVGDIRPEKLALVGERFDIEPLKKFHAKETKNE